MATICILLPCHWDALKGGAEYQANCLARYIAENTSHDVVYLARNVANTGARGSYRIERIPTGGRLEKYGLFLDSPALYRTLTRLAPDLVLQHVGGAYTGVAAWYCRNRGRPLIWYLASDVDARRIKRPLTLKNLPARIDDFFLRYGIRHAGTIVAQTQSQAQELKRNYGRMVDHVVPNFHTPARERIGKSAGMEVLWVCNFKRLKQPELFLRLAESCRNHPRLRFRLIGRREPSRWCDDLLEQVARMPNAEYLGELPIEEVNKRLAEAHVLVNTSEYEGFPNTFIQAWLREVPVLSLNVDPDDVISRHGLGSRAGTLERMQEWLLSMANNPGELAKMGVRARHFAEQHYSMRNAQRMVEVIEGALLPEAAGKLYHRC